MKHFQEYRGFYWVKLTQIPINSIPNYDWCYMYIFRHMSEQSNTDNILEELYLVWLQIA